MLFRSGNGCTQDLCDNGKCKHPNLSDGSACADDGIACTADVCAAGACKHNPAEGLKCTDDGKPCTDDVCQAGKCVHPNSTAACDDGNPCTQNDVCSNGACKAGPLSPTQCDDKNPCTKDVCDPKQGGCVHSNADFASCAASSSECPIGVCQGGQCFSKPNQACQAQVDIDLCTSQKVAGVCSADGKCTPTASQPSGFQCPNCKTVCIKCSIFNVCLDGFIGVP